MSRGVIATLDGNEAAASIAHRLSEVVAIYPITPSSPMGEWADEWSAGGKTNVWGTVPTVVELQSEAGAAGAVHGSLQAGALTTTFTSSQGLLLHVPNMFKIAGELLSYAMHVAARTVATQGLSIFGDHSDVMACRQTGFAFLCSGSVQEAHDLAAVAHAATLSSRLPFLHFFDGFRTSHELAKIELLSDEDLRELIREDLIRAHRARALTPDRPVLRGAAVNPDVFFQLRESSNQFYAGCPDAVRQAMAELERISGRSYHLFDYFGHAEAERVLVVMGSGAEVAHETAEWLVERGERVGVLKVRLYRPFSAEHFVRALPPAVRSIAVLDRTKEPGALGEPLYLDVLAALSETEPLGLWPFSRRPRVIGGRYGLSSKEFDPAMVKAVFDELAKDAPKQHFTVGIEDDVTYLSLPVDPAFDTEREDVVRAVFYGLGADGTVGANKNSIKIIGEETENYAQAYFVYDSKKSGGVTVSHLRFGPRPIRSSYYIKKASFVACHQWRFLDRFDVLGSAAPDGVFLLNAPYPPDKVWDFLPREVQAQLIEKCLRFFVVDGYRVAAKTGMGVRINSVMQTCFFAISGILPRDEAIARIKAAVEKTYGKKGEAIVRKNWEAIDETMANLFEVPVPKHATATRTRPPTVSDRAPDFVRNVEAPMMAGRGDELPVSAVPVDGTWPLSTSRWEKRSIAHEIPLWDPEVCIQCGRCSFVCPHATIRTKLCGPEDLAGAPESFLSAEAKGKDFAGLRYVVQVAPEDCTGCRLCVTNCPGKSKSDPSHKAINLAFQPDHREREAEKWEFFVGLPDRDPREVKLDVKGSQLLPHRFEFCGACAGCGEAQYVRYFSQLFGDRALVANATGCTSIYSGNLPTTPYCTDRSGRGPAWANSLFEDNAEFGFGMRVAVDKHREQATELLVSLGSEVGRDLVEPLLDADQSGEPGISAQRERVAELKTRLREIDVPRARSLETLADYLVKKSVWIVGGDGWAYDIGYGGLDHVLAMGRDVNILVVDTEVYSNTGGQQSKATPKGATAKFAAAGKETAKKDLGLIAMTYGTVYVAAVAWGADMQQTLRVLAEAESYPGTSLIIAYSHCIGHGYDLALGVEQQKLAVASGHWILYRFDPRLAARGLNPLQLDSGPPKVPLSDYVARETRYRLLQRLNPERAKHLLAEAERDARRRYSLYEQLSRLALSEQQPQPPAPGGGR
ncbi:MAG: pyruvate:ferredoxin (flavodoxin) oxidoreductase [Deltaproteobacteria bacterium]|nr:pyruvate:ferredoxin (flavodoxin) oxidoreductase [Deltaproteobacteria bacterium]